MLVLVNVQAPRDWTDGVNQTLATFAGRYRNVELANWQAAIAPSVGELADDQIHPGGPITGGIYCDAVRDALQRLAELPPLRTEDEYRYVRPAGLCRRSGAQKLPHVRDTCGSTPRSRARCRAPARRSGSRHPRRAPPCR